MHGKVPWSKRDKIDFATFTLDFVEDVQSIRLAWKEDPLFTPFWLKDVPNVLFRSEIPFE